MVATSAFGMGVNKSNIRNIIRYGVPENVCTWAQELGRAGRDGKPSKATIFYTMSDIEHAGAWIKGRINTIHSDQVLKGFSQSWKYVLSHLAFKCRREMLLTLFEDQHNGVVEKKRIVVMYAEICCKRKRFKLIVLKNSKCFMMQLMYWE